MDTYRKNIKALSRSHPHLVSLIDPLIIDDARVKVFNTNSGDLRILFTKEDGEQIYIHNAENPTECANRAIDLLGKMGKEGIVVLFGFGLGYFAEEIFKRFEKGHMIIVYEATPELFKTALKARDLTGLLESEQVKIIVGEDTGGLSILHDNHHLLVNGKFWIVKHHPSTRINEDAYERFYKLLNDEKRLSDSGVATAIGLGKEFMNAFMANIPAILRNLGVNRLKDIFRGRPAIIVSAGPSLEKNFHLLKYAKGKAIIIAVDVALPTLLPAGIYPDVIVAIDPLSENMAVFRDNPLLKNIPFVCFAQFTPEIVKLYPGPLFINNEPGNPIFQWLGRFWEDKGYIPCFGGSVSHLAFGVAEHIGAGTIALIGQDLSFRKKLHAGETTQLIHDFIDMDVPDFRKGAYKVLDMFGNEVFSRSTFLSFKTSLEKKIKTFKGKVINATEGGLNIEGTQPMRLSDFINEYCDLPVIDTYTVLSKLSEREVRYNMDGMLAELKASKDVFSNIKKHSSRILKHIRSIRKLKEKGKEDSEEFHKMLRKVELLTEKISNPMLNLLSGYNYALELYMKRQDIKEIDEIKDEWKKLDEQLERGSKFYNELVKTINQFNKHLDRLINDIMRENSINALLSDQSLKSREKYIKAGLIYKRASAYSMAARFLEMAKEINGLNNNDCIKSDGQLSSHRSSIYIPLCEVYIEQFRYYEARELLTMVKGKDSELNMRGSDDRMKIERLVRLCDEKISLWEKRTDRMIKLAGNAEKNYGSDLESGYFYFRIGNLKRAEEAFLSLINSRKNIGEEKDGLLDAYYGLAHIYLSKNNPERAVDVLGQALAIDRDNHLIYRDLGLIAIQNCNYESAELFLMKAIELAPDQSEPYRILANMYESTGQSEKALTLYEDAINMNKGCPDLQRDLAMMYRNVIEDSGGCQSL